MADIDPTDHARSTIPRAGEALKDTRSLPGYFPDGLGHRGFGGVPSRGGDEPNRLDDRAQRDRGRRVGVVFLRRRRVARVVRQSPGARG